MSASYAATERAAGSPRRYDFSVVPEAASNATGFIGRIIGAVTGAVKKVWSWVTGAFTKAIDIVKQGFSRLAEYVPASAMKFAPLFAVAPFSFKAVWAKTVSGFRWLWDRTIGWLYTRYNESMLALRDRGLKTRGPLGMFYKAVSFVMGALPLVSPLAIGTLLLLGKIGLLTGFVAMITLSPLTTLMALSGVAGKVGDAVLAKMAWYGRGYTALTAVAVYLGYGTLALSAFPLVSLVALSTLTFMGWRQEFSTLIGESLGLDSTEHEDAEFAAALIEKEKAQQGPLDENELAELVDEQAAHVNVTKSRLNRGYDGGKKVVYVREGQDINLKTVEVEWKHGIAYLGDTPVAADLRPGLSAQARDGRRKAFARAIVKHAMSQTAQAV